MIRQLARRVPLARAYSTTIPALGGGGPTPAPFTRTPAPTRQLNEDHELIWDDGVAAETCIDFDAPHISQGEGAQWWFAGMGFFATLGVFMLFCFDACASNALLALRLTPPCWPVAGAQLLTRRADAAGAGVFAFGGAAQCRVPTMRCSARP